LDLCNLDEKDQSSLAGEKMNAFGIDISTYNYSDDGSKKPDFSKIEMTCQFIAIRSGISWGYQDKWFNYSWEGSKHICRMAYHVLYFSEDATRQMDNLFRILGTSFKPEHDRLVLDCEVQHSNGKQLITATTKRCMEIIHARTEHYPIIYSRASWINNYLNLDDLPAKELWLAQYRYANPYPLYTLESNPPPVLPMGADYWLIHQTAEKYSGKEVGVPSHYVDSNRWNGDVMDVWEYFGYTENNPPTGIGLSLEEKVERLWQAHGELHG
jgi:GH25 family lysozyme M1 (1,4-beta-N-acetylmuramidase)